MNVSSPVHTHPAEQQVSEHSIVGSVELVHRVPRPGPADRFVMRIAVAMLIWSTRPDAEHTPHISTLVNDPHAPLYVRHAADGSLARGALLHGVYVLPVGL